MMSSFEQQDPTEAAGFPSFHTSTSGGTSGDGDLSAMVPCKLNSYKRMIDVDERIISSIYKVVSEFPTQVRKI